MVSSRFHRLRPSAQAVLLGVVGAGLAMFAWSVADYARLATAPPALVVALGALTGVGRCKEVQRAFGGGRLDNRFLPRLLTAYVCFAALCEAVGLPCLFPLCAAFSATVHLQWSGSRRWPSAITATFGVGVALDLVAAALDRAGVMVSPLSHDESAALFLASMLLGLLTVVNAVALTRAREWSERALETERTRRQDELMYAATHDGLTGVLNRAGLARAVQDVMPSAAPGRGVGVLFLDLDGFKSVNDRLGHAAGDELLRLAARRIEDAVRSQDVVVRTGGDEFVVLAVDADSSETLAVLAQRIEAALVAPFDLLDGTATVGASIGTAFAAAPATDLEELFQAADGAMYRMKALHHAAARTMVARA